VARAADPPRDEPRRDEPRRDGPVRRALRVAVLSVTLLFVVAALAISSSLVIYTAYRHELQNGIFALLLAVLSAQIAINWFLWKDEEE